MHFDEPGKWKSMSCKTLAGVMKLFFVGAVEGHAFMTAKEKNILT